MQGIEEFAAETRRIIESPYVPCLKRLHSVLETIDSRSLQRWARGNICQINALAAAVLEGLELWPFSLQILTQLCCIMAFRSAILQQQPLLLSAMLEKAVGSESGYEKYGDACIPLLSTSFDDALPSSFPAFLEKTLNRAIDNMSTETIRPLHNILSALGSSHFECLSQELLGRLQDQLQAILRSLPVDENVSSLLCLSVLAQLTAVKSSSKQEQSTLSRQCHRPAHLFFTGKHAQKTLDLIVLKSISICSASCKLAIERSLEGLLLTEGIAHAIEPAERQAWCARNVVKTKKLYEKILRSDIDQELQSAAINLVVILIGDLPLPENLRSAFTSNMLTAELLTLSPAAVSKGIRDIDSDILTKQLATAIRVVRNDGYSSLTSLTVIENATCLISAFAKDVEALPSLCNTILACIQFEDPLGELDQCSHVKSSEFRDSDMHSVQGVCPSMMIRAKGILYSKICMLLLKCGLLSTQPLNSKIQKMFFRLLEIQQGFTVLNGQCTAFTRARRASETRISLLEADGTPEACSMSHNWRDTLFKQMSRDVSSRYDSIIRIVSDVCRDLELRCHEVERPLCEEQKKASALQNRLDDAQMMVEKLQEEARIHVGTRESLRAENDQLRKQLGNNERRLGDMSISLEGIKQEFDQAKTEAQRVANAAAESSREQDLAYMATLKGRDELFKQQGLDLDRARTRIETLEAEAGQAKVEDAERVQKMQHMQSSVTELQRQTEIQEATIKSEESEIDLLHQVNLRLTEEKDEANAVARETADRQDSTVANLKTQLEEARSETKNIQAKFEDFAKSTDAESTTLKIQHHKTAQDLQNQLIEAEERAVETRREYDSVVLEMQKTNAKLREDRDRREKEFSKAQELSRRLMMVVGIPDPVASPGTKALKHDPYHQKLHKSFQATDKAFSSLSAESITQGSESSYPSRGPSPKRNKIRKTPLPRWSKTSVDGSKSKTPARTSFQASRPPLSDALILQNRRFTTPALQRNKKEGLASIDDSPGMLDISDKEQYWSSDEYLDGDDIFASTDQKRLPLFKNTSRLTYDNETTTEL